MASEMRDELDDLINDKGDFPLYLADQLQPEWRIPVTLLEFEADRDGIVISATD